MSKNKQEYEAVCDELDRLAIAMLDAVKEYIDCKVLIENYIKTGSLHLAKARYIMGNKSVSSLQLPTEDWDTVAQTKVSHSQQKHGSMESLYFELERFSLNDESTTNEVGLRERKTPRFGSSLEGMTDVEVEKTSTDKSKEDDKGTDSGRTLTISKDPLKWFGVLVPQNLKYAQSNFSTCIEYVVQCTNLQMEMESIRIKYKNLLNQKQELSQCAE